MRLQGHRLDVHRSLVPLVSLLWRLGDCAVLLTKQPPSFYPQIWINWRRKSTTGLSMDFLCLNPIGFTCLTVRP